MITTPHRLALGAALALLVVWLIRAIWRSFKLDSALEVELRQETRAAIIAELSRVFTEAGARR